MSGAKGFQEGQGGTGMDREGIHLTDREFEVLCLAAKDMGSRTIGKQLGISMVRVKRIKRHIKEILGLDSDSETKAMVERARRLGFIEG